MADFTLVVGVDTSLSFTEMQSGINEIVSKLNANPPKIKVKFDEASLKTMQGQLNALQANINATAGRSPVNTASLSEVAAKAGQATSAVQNMNKAISSTSAAAKSASEAERQLKKIADAATQARALLNKNMEASGSASYQKLNAELTKLETILQTCGGDSTKLSAALNSAGIDGESAVTRLNTAMATLKNELQTTGTQGTASLRQITEMYAQMRAMLNSNPQMAGTSQFAALSAQASAFRGIIESCGGDASMLEAALHSAGLNGATALETAKMAMASFKAEIASADSAERRMTAAERAREAALKSYRDAIIQGEAALRKWTAAEHSKNESSRAAYQRLKDSVDAMRSAKAAYDSGTGSIENLRAKTDEYKATLKDTERTIRSNGDATKSFSERMDGLAKKFGAWLSVTQVIMLAVRAMRQMVKASVELDSAMTQMQIVTKASTREMEEFGNTAAKVAKRTASTITDVIDSATVFARLGYTMDESARLAEFTAMLQNVGDIDASDAQDAITSIIKAYDIDASEIESVMDMLVEVGNHFPISVSQIAEGMTNASSTLHAAGNSFEQSVALLTAANTTIQDAAKSSTGLRTIAARIRNTKTELDDLGEVMTEASYEELVQTLTDCGVALTDINGEYRSTYDIMSDIAAKWDTLDSMQQAALATALSGTRQQAVFYSIIENFQEASGAMEAMAGSAGALTDAYKVYLDSAQAHIDIFKASFQELAKNFIDAGFIKTVVDFGATILNILNIVAKLIGIFGGLNTILYTTLGIITVIKAEVILTSIWGFFTGIATGLLKLGTILKSVGAAIKVFVAMTKASRDASAGAMMVYGQSTGVLGRLSAAFNAVGISASTAQIAVAAFMIVLTALILVIQSVNKAQEEAEQEAEEIRQQNIQAAQTAKTLSDELSTLINRYIELNDVVGVNDSNIEQLIDTKAGLIDKLQIEEEELDRLIEKYGSYSDAVKQATVDKLQDTERDLRGAIGAREEELLKAAEVEYQTGVMGTSASVPMNNLIYVVGTASEKLEGVSKELAAINALDSVDGFDAWANGTGFGFRIEGMTFEDLETVDGVLEAYYRLGEALDIVADTVGSDNEVYRQLYAQYSVVSAAVNNYKGSITDLNRNLAEQYMLNGLIGQEIPKTKDEFDAYRSKVVEAAVSSGEFIGSEREIESSIDAVLAQQPQFMHFYESIADGSSTGVAGLNDLSETLQKLKSAYSILETAQKEMATGGLSADTIKAMADETEDYIDYLYEENGVIKLNTEAWKEYANEKMLGDISYINDEIKALQDNREEILSTSNALYKEVEAIMAVGEEYNALTNGNVDYNKRPLVSPEKMREVYPEFDGEIGTTYSSTYTIGEGEALYTIEVTPILEDGTVLSADAISEYVNNLITTDGIEGVLESDTSNLILNIQPGEYDEEYWNKYQEQIGAVKNQHWELIKQLQADTGLSWEEILEEYTVISALLAENTSEIEANQDKLRVYEGLYNSVTNSLNAYTEALSGFTEVSNKITSVSDSLTKVADLQETVANGFTISLEKALEFANVYPEILNGATVAADGQIALNEGVVNAFIEGKEAELKAQIDAEIKKLDGDKSVLEAKMAFAQAQLSLAQSVGDGEGQISKELAQYRVQAGNAVAQALIESGIDEATAYQLACAAMAQNSEEFNRVAALVCTDVAGNFDTAAYSAAQSIYNNMKNAAGSLDGVIKAAHNAAAAISGVGSGTQAGSTGSFSGSGGTTRESISVNTTSGSFDGTNYSYEAREISLDDFISELEVDISAYQNAIAQIDGQIATLKALRNTSLSKFSTSNKNSGKGSGSGSSKDNEPTWFEKEYALHQHLLKMDAENVEDYLDWLNSAYQRAYNEGIIDLGDFYKYQEEVYSSLQDLFKDYLNDVEHEISMREKYEGESDKIIELYKKLMNDVEKEIAAARAQGLDDTDDYIQELQKKWQGYYDSVTDIRESAEDDAKDAIDELVDYRIDMIKQEIEDEKDALDKKLDNLKEFYDKQKEMLQDVYDEEKYLDEQSEKRKSVTDIQAELAQLEFDDSAWAQKRKLQLQAELADAQKELEDFEKQHALDEALGLLDDAYDAQEKEINAEMEALEKKLNDPEALYNQALADISNNTEELYQEMLEYNRRHGTGNDEDVTDMWEAAYKALLEYHDIYGEWYNGIDLGNYTGYEEPQESWDTAPVSESGSQTQPEQPPASTQTKPEHPPATTHPSTPETPALTDSIKKHVAAAIWNGNYGWEKGSTRDNRLTEVFGSNNGIQAIVNKGYQYVAGISPSGYSYTDMRKKFKGYASGTRKAAPGMHAVDELGAEYLFTSADGNRYRVFSGGEKVLNAKATEFLYEFANSGKDILEKIAKSFMDTSSLGRIQPIVNNNEIHMGDITIQGNATQSTVSEIRRAQRESLENMLREFNRLNK